MNDKTDGLTRQQLALLQAEPHITIQTDFSLWNFLFQGYANQGPHRFTKAEAYFDLLNRERLAALTKDDEFLNSSIQTLSNVWSWERASVKKFIGTLCSIGAASVKSDGYKYTVRLTNIYGLSPQVCEDHKNSPADSMPLTVSHLIGELSEDKGP